MIVNPMFLWHHLHREQELHGEDYHNQLLMLKIWILDEEFIAGSFVGYGEKKTRAVTCTFQAKLSGTQTDNKP